MDELIERSISLVNQNIDDNCKCEVREIISCSICALLLIKPSLVLELMPKILKELTIICDERTVVEMEHDELKNFLDDDNLKNSSACVSRMFFYSNGVIINKNYLLISWSEYNLTSIICTVVHEFIHLLRHSRIINDGEIINIKSGIRIDSFNIFLETCSHRNLFLEEGIVQFYTNIAVNELKIFLNDLENLKYGVFDEFKKNISNNYMKSYFLQTNLLNKLVNDSDFLDAMDDSFYEFGEISKMESYFDEVMEVKNSFYEFSKLIDKCYLELFACDVLIDFKKDYEMLNNMVDTFFEKKKIKKK